MVIGLNYKAKLVIYVCSKSQINLLTLLPFNSYKIKMKIGNLGFFLKFFYRKIFKMNNVISFII